MDAKQSLPHRAHTLLAMVHLVPASFFCVPALPAIAETPVPILTLTGHDADEYFGYSIAAAGDVNGDGDEDVLVGAHRDGVGRVYVYFGGFSADSIPDLTLTSEPDPFDNGFGFAVAGVGDVNGDGYADVAVGWPNGGYGRGRVWVFYGGPGMDDISDLTFTGTSTGEQFGSVIAPTLDLNDDGYKDLIVGAPLYQDGYDFRGRVYIFSGGPGVDAEPDLILETPIQDVRPSSSHFGSAVAPAGDVNGDGRADLIVGHADVRHSGQCCFARAFLYLGGAGMDGSPDRSLKSSPFTSYLPRTASSAGDFNADGYADVAVAAPVMYADGTGVSSSPGRVYVYFGAPTAPDDPAPSLRLAGDASDLNFGHSISGGMDLNGDGHPDLLIGDPYSNFDGHRRGRAYVFYGGANADSVPDVILNGELDGRWFGATTSVGDVNGDGVADAIIGTRSSPPLGKVYVYDLAIPLQARGFVRGDHRTIALANAGSPVCVRFEPVDAAYANSNVDPSTLRLTSEDSGDVVEISPLSTKAAVEGDTDGNGIGELGACFGREDLRRLLPTIRGRRTIEVGLVGRVHSGRRFRAPVSLTIVGTGRKEGLASTIRPNPLNPQATLSFVTTKPGRVTVRLFDVSGRCVRTIIAQNREVGPHELHVDGRDDRGAGLASGVYYYRIDAREGASSGRFVIAR